MGAGPKEIMSSAYGGYADVRSGNTVESPPVARPTPTLPGAKPVVIDREDEGLVLGQRAPVIGQVPDPAPGGLGDVDVVAQRCV